MGRFDWQSNGLSWGKGSLGKLRPRLATEATQPPATSLFQAPRLGEGLRTQRSTACDTARDWKTAGHLNPWGRDVEQGVTSEDLADSKWGRKIDSFFCPHLLSARLEGTR